MPEFTKLTQSQVRKALGDDGPEPEILAPTAPPDPSPPCALT